MFEWTRDEIVAVWTERDIPARLVYRQARWRVEGAPEPLVETFEHPLITHAPTLQTGWICSIRRDGGSDTRRVVLRRAGARWEAEEVNA